ncbi:MAG TPA: feruloyl-CoA synthase [Methylomirabilota bacterium]|nr:feruloyl-CoA synthase [Methylomirabilota bacterium]
MIDEEIDVALGDFRTLMEARPDGALHLRSAEPLGDCDRAVTDRLDHWAVHRPDSVFLAQRDSGGDWRRITFAETRRTVRRLATTLIRRGLSAERPLAILSGNDIEQGLLGLAAMYAGIPFAPISPAYSLVATDFERLRSIIARLTPGMVYATDATPFARAIAAAAPEDVPIVARVGVVPGRRLHAFDVMVAEEEPALVDAANASIRPDTVAKILFTSGSTGVPKGVPNTQRMLTAGQRMFTHWFAFGRTTPMVLVDWLPWHHTFGGNQNFGYTLQTGGSLYIDAGKPTPKGMAETIRNLREISPTTYFNVPKGFEELVRYLRRDEDLRRTFFRDLRINFYAGASLPDHVGEALDELAIATVGRTVPMVSGLGATETAPSVFGATRRIARPGNVGVPLPGVEVKLVPGAGKLEVRVKGPNVMTGYWRDPVQTAKVFDEEGYYRLGDAVRFVRDGDPDAGFVFDGRISEDFKLMTGSWVSVGPLRARIFAAFGALLRDSVVAGHDRDDVTALLFPEVEACRALVPNGNGLAVEAVLASPEVRAAFAQRLRDLRAGATGSSNRVERVTLLVEPPSIDANEITDKGSINQGAVLKRRAAQVEALYAAPPPPEVILP